MPNEINKIAEALSKAGIIVSQGIYQRQDRLDAENIYDQTVKGYEDYKQSMKIYNDALSSAQTLLDGGQNPKMPIKPSFDGVATSFFEALGDLGANPQGAPYKDALSQLYKSLTTNQEPLTRTVGNDLLQWNESTQSWEKKYEAPFERTPYSGIDRVVIQNPDGTYSWQIPLYDKNTETVTYTYAPARLEDWKKQQADDIDNSMTNEDNVRMKKSYSISTGNNTRKSSYTPTKKEEDIYNNVIGYYRDGKKWATMDEDAKQKYIAKEKWLADTYFNGDVSLLQQTKDKIVNQTTKEGKETLKKVTDQTLRKDPKKQETTTPRKDAADLRGSEEDLAVYKQLIENFQSKMEQQVYSYDDGTGNKVPNYNISPEDWARELFEEGHLTNITQEKYVMVSD